jgi:sarcosine oxidase subunit alpha
MISRHVTFYFEGRPLRGVEGEPIARALFNAGIRTLSNSVKYKRPRSLFCARGRCSTCHMSVDGVPGVPTCITPLREGMRVEREHYQPLLSPVLTTAARLIEFPAGFYYRMFTRPAPIRELFLGTLRKMAGIGRIDPDPKYQSGKSAAAALLNDLRNDYEIAVVGAGLSGMSAAIDAAERGARVLLVDEYGFAGGHSFGYQPDDGLASARDDLVRRIASHPSIDYRPLTTAQGFYPPNTLLLGPGGSTGFSPYAGGGRGGGEGPSAGMAPVSSRAFVFATGANDAIPLFENNDTPGIFGNRALRLLLERDDLRPGRRAVVFGSGPELRVAAQLLLHHDIKIVALVDPAPADRAAADSQRRRVLDKVRTINNAKIVSARGGEWLKSIDVADRSGSGRNTRLPCDLLCVANPGQPAYELPYQAGFHYALAGDGAEEERMMIPTAARIDGGDDSPRFHVVGGAAGIAGWREKIADGKRAAESM